MIGLFGGTFDPVHLGHLRSALEIREQLDIGDFRWLPAGQPPHRSGTVTPAGHRLAMLRLALKGREGARIDERELERPGPSYMVDTLREVRAEAGQAPVCLIIGQDSAASLDTWHRWEELFGLAHIAIVQRPDGAGPAAGAVAEAIQARMVDDPAALRERAAGCVCPVRVTQLDVSSSAIRALVRAGRSARYLVPDAVLAYLQDHGLYRPG